MGFTQSQLDRVVAVVSAAGPDAPTALRAALPGGMVTLCDASDVSCDTPWATLPGWALHLVDRSSHCWTLTTDPALATGFLLARA